MISFIIPTRNEEKTIQKTLRALKDHLTDFDYEIIVSDENSGDQTSQVAHKYAQVVLPPPNPGRPTIAKGRNRGAAAAKGEYLVFIDADVIVPNPNEFLRKALSYFEKYPDLVALTVKLRVFPETETWADRFFFNLANCTQYVSNNVLKFGSAPGEFQMIKAGAFKKIRGYREDMAVSEDLDLFRRLAHAGKTMFAGDLMVYHSGRRAHKIGWAKLLWEWFKNAVSVIFFNKSADDEWTPIR